MPFLITDSDKPLLMDTVPALKLTHFNGEPARGEVYAYMRCYACNGALHLSFTEFDEAPPEGTHMALALMPADKDDSFLYLTLDKAAKCDLKLLDARTNNCVKALTPPSVSIVTGSDEQGLYWCAETVIEKEIFDKVLSSPMKSGSVFAGNVFLCKDGEAAFGSAFKVPIEESVPTTAGFDVFTLVPY